MQSNGDATPTDESAEAEIEELRKKIQALGSDLQGVNGELHKLVRERPLIMLGAALAAGFLVGRVIRRT